MAEVLITLGIIGVVMALTMPILIQNHKKQVAQTRLKKFNSTMSQAVVLAEQDGVVINDLLPYSTREPETIKKWFDTYLAPYINYEKVDLKGTGINVYMPDSSSFLIWKAHCTEINFDINASQKPNKMGQDQYNFMICTSTDTTTWNDGRHWGTYYNGNQNTRDKRLSACKQDPRYCSGLLEYDNWEFKSDYPYKL